MGYKNWQTPPDFFEILNKDHKFTVDACGAKDDPIREQLPRFWGEKEDGLAQSWKGERVFCNPPYDDGIPKWLEKRTESLLTFYLLPPSIDTLWFHDIVAKDPLIVWGFYRGRLKFWRDGKPGPSPRAGNLLVLYRSMEHIMASQPKILVPQQQPVNVPKLVLAK